MSDELNKVAEEIKAQQKEEEKPQIDYWGGVAPEDKDTLLSEEAKKMLDEEKWTLRLRAWENNNKCHTYFEKISEYADIDLPTPMRKTWFSAGYDLAAAEDVIIPPYAELAHINGGAFNLNRTYDLKEMSDITKKSLRPTLIPTGYKCRINGDQYVQLSIRSSSPLKYWLVLANGVGIIDADYYNNPDNEGHIFFQVINLSPFPIQIHKGDIIGQAIVMNYNTLDVDLSGGIREGGFGSTTPQS